MRALTPSLASAQRGHTARPCVQLLLDDRHVGVWRLRFQELYSGEEGSGPCAMACSNGYILRAWADASGNLRLCRTPAGASSGWGEWSLLATGVSPDAQVALAAKGSDAFLLYAAGGGRELLCRRSQDGGLSWGAAQLIHTAEPGVRLRAIAAICASAHDCICLFADDGQGTQPDDLVHVAWLRQGAWSAATWPRDAGDGVAGLAALCLNGDESYSSVHFALCGAFEDTARPAVRLYHLQLTADGQRLWTYRGPLLVGEVPGFGWAWPAIVAATGDRPRLFLCQQAAGSSRLGHLFLLRLGLTGPTAAGEFVPLPLEAPQGVGAVACGGFLYIGSARQVWRAPAPGTERLEVSTDVISCRLLARHRGPGSLEILLDNSRGQYSPGVQLGGALRLGAQVSLRLGYLTAAGAELLPQAPCWVEEAVHLSGGQGGGTVLLRCYDGWGKLWRSAAERAYEWETSPALVLQEALERFGFFYSDDGSPSLYCAGRPPRFSLAAGQPWGSLVARALDYSGCELRFFANAQEEPTWPSARAHVFTPESSPSYAYGPTEHPFLAAALSRGEGVAWAQVFGDGLFGEALDDEAIAELGFAPLFQLVELRLGEGMDISAMQEASFALRRARWAAQGQWLLSRPNVGQELLDVVSIQASGQGWERRVLGMELRYDRRHGLYEQRLHLGSA